MATPRQQRECHFVAIAASTRPPAGMRRINVQPPTLSNLATAGVLSMAVCRLLRANGLLTSPAFMFITAADEFK